MSSSSPYKIIKNNFKYFVLKVLILQLVSLVYGLECFILISLKKMNGKTTMLALVTLNNICLIFFLFW